MSHSARESNAHRLHIPSANPYLTVVAPAPLAGESIVVAPGDRILIGREGALAMESIGLSRQHAWLEYDGNTLVITDAGSTNGTTVNGRPIDGPTVLVDTDSVGLGELQAIVAIAPTDPPPPIRKPSHPEPSEQAVLASETTRRLCAAVQTNRNFREYVIDEIVEEPYRAICPSYGVELVTVAMHAVAAQRRLLLRDGALAALLLVLLVSAASRWASTGDLSTVWTEAAEVVVFVLLASWLVVVATRLFEGHVVLVRNLWQPGSHTDPPRLTVTSRLRDRLAAIRSTQGGNVTVFSDYLPFVGSGLVFDRWSFAIDLERGAVDKVGKVLKPRSFTAGDLYDALESNLVTTGIPELSVEERLHVHGRDVKNYRELLPQEFGRPVPRASQSLLRHALTSTSGAARTYLCIQATGWRGQLVASIFFRAVRLPSALYLESTSTALLPLASEFLEASGRPRDALGVTLESIGIGSIETLPSLLLSPVRVAQGASRALRYRQRRQDQRHRIADGNFDYGSVTSVREEAAGTSFNRYYLEFDRDMYDKVLQERILQHVMDFLAAHDVDTSAFGQHMLTINTQNTYNQNVQNMSGGNVVGGAARLKGGVKMSAVTGGQNPEGT